MRAKLFFFAGAAFALVGRLAAGTLELAPKETAPPTITQSEPWHLTIAAPGWMSSLDGTIGIRGVNADVDVGFDQILQHLDMIWATRAELSKGRFGIYSEFIYVGLSAGANVNGLVQSVHDVTNEYYIDGGLSWKLIDQPRGSLALAAGTHYFNLYEQLTLHGNLVRIHQASEQFIDNINAALRERLDNDIFKSEFLEILKGTTKEDIANRIGNALDRHEHRPTIPIGPLGGRIRQEVAQVVERFIEAKADALRIRIDALKLKGAARRAAVNRLVNLAKADIARQLATTLD